MSTGVGVRESGGKWCGGQRDVSRGMEVAGGGSRILGALVVSSGDRTTCDPGPHLGVREVDR
jgi:hypothetical protein